MKLLYIFLLALVVWSCDNDLNILEDEKDIPVVYGILSISDSAQYIRIERAFIDGETSAFELAQNPDEFYYENINVSIRHENTGAEYPLVRVNGNDEGYVRDEGVFAQDPNYLYKIDSDDIDLIEDTEYTLLIDRGDSLPVVNATTRLVGAGRITTPVSVIGFDYIQPTKVRWRPGAGARTYDVKLRFNYRERVTASSQGFENKSAEWLMARNFNSSGSEIENLEVPGINFYTFLSGALVADPAIERRIDDVAIILISGGQEILDLNRVSGANLGITSSQDVPFYTNLSEGRGIFSSKHRSELIEIDLKSATKDSIIAGSITKELNFK